MSTRGLWGIRGITGREDGKEEIGIFHRHDSYPTYLGGKLIGSLIVYDLDSFREFANGVKIVKESDFDCFGSLKEAVMNSVYLAQQDLFKSFTALYMGKQGNLVVFDEFDFIYDSLWCEWAYMINLETQCLEIYRGFNTDPNEAGSYASKKAEDSSKYYGCRLLYEIPIERIKLIKSEKEIEIMCDAIEEFKDCFSLKYDYEPDSEEVNQATEKALKLAILVEEIEKQYDYNDEVNLILSGIIYGLQDTVKPKRIKSDLDFTITLSEKSANLGYFAPILEIYLSQNENAIALLESISGKDLEQLRRLREEVEKKRLEEIIAKKNN